MKRHISVQQEPFDFAKIVSDLKSGEYKTGACVTFTGSVRDLDRSLSAMTLEHFPGMTEAEINRISDEAMKRWSIEGLTVIHRYGRLEPGEDIVLVAVLSAHRGDAFDSARFIMDTLKTTAPFWKKEETNSGTRWVEAHESDDKQASKWIENQKKTKKEAE